MAILSGFFKTIKYRLTDAGYKWQSEKTSSQTVVMGDGNDVTDTVENRFGTIEGITSSLASTSDNYALSASAGKDLQDQVTELNSSLSKKEDKVSTPNLVLVNGSMLYTKVARVGNIVGFSGSFACASGTTLNSDVALARLSVVPSTFPYYFPCIFRNTGNGTTTISWGLVDTNGYIKPASSNSSYNEMRINTTFVCN